MREDGVAFGEEYTLVAVADYVLQHTPGNTVSNLSSTRALRDVTEKHGQKYEASAVGEVNVVNKMKEVNAGFTQFTIPADAYPDMCGPVQSVSVGTRVIANCDASDEAIYGMSKAVYERLGELGMTVAALKSTPPDMLRQDVGIKQHLGSIRVHEEVGQ